MKKSKKLNFYIVVISGIFFISSCNKDDLFDFYIGSQPNFLNDHPFVPGLNIFGVIRPDSLEDKSLNSIYIEKVIPAVNETEDSTTVVNFDAVIYKTNNNLVVDSLSFIYSYPDTIFTHKPVDFDPLPGNHFKIICHSPGLPVLMAETIIPNIPVIFENSINVNGNKVQFFIASDSTAYLYDVYLFDESYQTVQRVLRTKNSNTSIEIDAAVPVSSNARLVIYTYDKNLAEYFTAPNLFIKPNTYRPPFTTVQGGYGCFGSLNLLAIDLNDNHYF